MTMPEPRTVLAYTITIAFIGVLVMLMLRPVELDDKTANILNILLGAMVGQLVNVYQFFFGSSSGSKDKDEALITAATNTTSNGERR